MKHWLLKTEPNEWSWKNQETQKITQWDGVRNWQAQGYLKQMKLGDLCFFYETGSIKAIVGIVVVSKEFYPDANDPKYGMIEVKFYQPIKNIVPLATIKNNPTLQHLILCRQPRLSVMPIEKQDFEKLLSMAE